MGNDKPRSIAFPDHIGCGLAGGDWDTYLALLTNFANANLDMRVAIVHLASTKSTTRNHNVASKNITSNTILHEFSLPYFSV